MTVWVDASSGASGDMLLGALVGAGVPVEVIQTAVDAVAPEPVRLGVETVARNGFAATRCHVDVGASTSHRTWADVRGLFESSGLEEEVRSRSLQVFERLAVAEATVHGTDPDAVTFHEVGALDSIADVVGACAGFAELLRGLPFPRSGGEMATSGGKFQPRCDQFPAQAGKWHAPEIVVSPVAVGSGRVEGAHGSMPVPPPAVAELLRDVPSYAGPPGAPAMELCTPTGAAILTTFATAWGPQPPMQVQEVGIGAGARDPQGHTNVLRLLVGPPLDAPAAVGTAEAILIETNVDDLDPRVWPSVISALLDAGGSDAWLTPALMKKGRPAHVLSVLVPPDRAAAVRASVFRETSAIGLREQRLDKHALDREMSSVDVGGHAIAVKVARHGDAVVNAMPEYDDVARAAAVLGRPVADVLAEAVAASRKLLG